MIALTSAPEPLPLPDGFPVGSPTPEQQRDAILALGAGRPWAALDWPDLLDALVALGRADIPLSRLVEGHIDALRILREAGASPRSGAAYGVWASRSQGTGLTAIPADGGWDVQGTVRFASGAGVLDRALVPLWLDEHTHVLADLPVGAWRFETGDWRTRAMELSRSHAARVCGRQEGAAVGAPNFYLSRWGFFPGGVGVAAVWTGGALRVLDLLAEASPRERRSSAAILRWGRADTDAALALASVRQAGRLLAARPDDPRPLATECRAGVAACVRRILDEAVAIAGPAGLAYVEPLTRAIDDLRLYVAQQNADSDAAYLGSLA